MTNTLPPSNIHPLASNSDLERLTWAQTRALIRSDFERLVTWYGGGGSLLHRAGWFLQPNYQCLFLYRLSRHFYLSGWRNLSRLLALVAVYSTGAEISPRTSIGPGCLVAHAYGVILFGKIGARASFFGQCGTGSDFGSKDIGGGPGYPVVGDDVAFGIKAVALGAIRIGDRAKLGPMSFVKRDVPDDGLVVSRSSKVLRRRSGSARTQADREPPDPADP